MIKRYREKRSGNQGFSLIELAIVLVIVTLLAGGLMMALTTQQEVQRLSEVRRQLADIREALLGYAAANGHLPAPANPTKSSGDEKVGESDEQYMNDNNGLGVLPWTTLGLPETDPWGQRFTYRVTPGFADKFIGEVPTIPACDPPPSPPAPTPTQASFVLCSRGNITVKDGNAVNIATQLPAIVISHGRNGLGGYGRDGQRRPGATGHEKENMDGLNGFFSHEQGPNFDDEVTWVPLPILMSRMLAAGRLP